MNKKVNIKKIEKLQKKYGYFDMQKMINSGECWKMEGSYGRSAMDLLETGVCMLPLMPRRDYYGNRVPSRKELRDGTKGTYKNCQNFWMAVENGEIEIN